MRRPRAIVVSAAGVIATALSVQGCGAADSDEPGQESVVMRSQAGSTAMVTAGTASMVPPMNVAGTMAMQPMIAGSGDDGPTSMNTSGQGAQAGSMAVAGTGAEDDTTLYHAEIIVPQVAPGEEGTQCVQVRLDNAESINIVHLHNKLSVASHHFILSKVLDPADGEAELAPCQ